MGVGVTWYTWLEQGRDITVSAPVLESLARVLQLNEDEKVHLYILAREQIPVTPFPATPTVTPALQLILETMGVHPAYVLCPRWDVIAWNQAAARVYADFGALAERERNLIWLFFTDRRQRELFVNWEAEAQHALASFRISTQRFIGEAWLTQLTSELEEASPEFRAWWPRYALQGCKPCPRQLEHPRVGSLFLETTTFQLAAYPGLQMIVDTPVPGTDTAARLAALAEAGSKPQHLAAV
ncbi:helix-turn-helix transcriptional regulator [Ktedonosporobacter rubrisoli]|uniref:helix-turn-helix transcriptional regulator n=1 Tax=Ktedonosporobacter rubrisoli TaxID=2509675 RepID=UPI0013EE6B50|nr:helix-turn-helix transcriptional regulator [Ktedonosporobacter rubrisoli]